MQAFSSVGQLWLLLAHNAQYVEALTCLVPGPVYPLKPFQQDTCQSQRCPIRPTRERGVVLPDARASSSVPEMFPTSRANFSASFNANLLGRQNGRIYKCQC
jgi:hypothetical protein